MELKSKLSGVDATLTLMRELGPRVNKNATRRAMRKAIKPMRQAARDRAPVDTRALKRAIKSKVRADRNGRVTGVVGIDKSTRGPEGNRPIRYAHIAEFGRDGASGHRFMTAAYETSERQSRDILEDELRNEVLKEAAKANAKKAA